MLKRIERGMKACRRSVTASLRSLRNVHHRSGRRTGAMCTGQVAADNAVRQAADESSVQEASVDERLVHAASGDRGIYARVLDIHCREVHEYTWVMENTELTECLTSS